MIDLGTEGMEGAEATLKRMEAMGSTTLGIQLNADQRGSVDNGLILEYQAEGIESKRGLIKRDITPSEDNANIAASIFMEIAHVAIDDAMGEAESLDAAKRAINKVSKKALKKAAEFIRKQMADRINRGVDNVGTKLEQVDDRYANYRMLKYGTGKGAVLKATGSLMKNLEKPDYVFTDKS